MTHWFLFLLFSSAAACDLCVHQSKASFVTSVSALTSGACGYGSFAISLSGGNLAAGVSSLYKGGAGCGACFQIRCKDPKLCSSEGAKTWLTTAWPETFTNKGSLGHWNSMTMSRKYGAVWGTNRVPNGALQFRFVVTSGYDGKWIWAKSVLPADWKPRVVYDSGVQITDIALESCYPCDYDGTW
ncbi:Expansin-like A2 [Hibiscus syriacus]|uniref:Expansin-like A2 n=1 Tax=Hibiscus syriacus TaxID=106335 RepID=A0A6A3BJJ1_HIBSY|nr:Expansin-like A2 [Hibiscus syriacus]